MSTRYFSRTGHYRRARQLAIDELGPDKVAYMSDSDIVEWVENKYYLFEWQDDKDTIYEEDVILIPKTDIDINKLNILHR